MGLLAALLREATGLLAALPLPAALLPAATDLPAALLPAATDLPAALPLPVVATGGLRALLARMVRRLAAPPCLPPVVARCLVARRWAAAKSKR